MPGVEPGVEDMDTIDDIGLKRTSLMLIDEGERY
jgi:hypothetical protein